MTDNLQALLELQDIDGRIRNLQREAKDLPRRRAQESARMKGVDAEIAIVRNQLDAARRRVRESEEESEAAKNRIKDLRISQTSADSNKEYQQIEVAIEGLEHEVSEADSRALALMESVPSLERKVAEAEQRAGNAKSGADDYCAEIDARIAYVKEELNAETQRRLEQAKKIPKVILDAYARLSAKRWPVLVALNDECVCEGCHLKVPPNVEQRVQSAEKMLKDVLGGMSAEEQARLAAMNPEDRERAKNARIMQQVVNCTNCGRMLYFNS